MKKKTYIAPASTVVSIHTENIMAASPFKISDKEGDQQLSNKGGGWNSSEWTDGEETEE